MPILHGISVTVMKDGLNGLASVHSKLKVLSEKELKDLKSMCECAATGKLDVLVITDNDGTTHYIGESILKQSVVSLVSEERLAEENLEEVEK